MQATRSHQTDDLLIEGLTAGRYYQIHFFDTATSCESALLLGWNSLNNNAFRPITGTLSSLTPNRGQSVIRAEPTPVPTPTPTPTPTPVPYPYWGEDYANPHTEAYSLIPGRSYNTPPLTARGIGTIAYTKQNNCSAAGTPPIELIIHGNTLTGFLFPAEEGPFTGTKECTIRANDTRGPLPLNHNGSRLTLELTYGLTYTPVTTSFTLGSQLDLETHQPSIDQTSEQTLADLDIGLIAHQGTTEWRFIMAPFGEIYRILDSLGWWFSETQTAAVMVLALTYVLWSLMPKGLGPWRIGIHIPLLALAVQWTPLLHMPLIIAVLTTLPILVMQGRSAWEASGETLEESGGDLDAFASEMNTGRRKKEQEAKAAAEKAAKENNAKTQQRYAEDKRNDYNDRRADVLLQEYAAQKARRERQAAMREE